MDVDLLIGIFPQVLLDGITLGFMYALIALGYTMVYGGLEFLNFAHSEISLIRLVESLWRNAFNLVYPTMDVLNLRFELSETIDVSVKSLVVIGGALLMLWALHLIVNRTKVGTAIRAVAEDQAAASLMGIDVNRIISLTFLIGGAMGGAAGVLFGVQYGLINPYSGFIPGLKAFTAAVLGGIGNIPGAMLGGLVLGLLEAFAASYLSLLTAGAFGAEYKDIFAFSILILILIFRPKGLLGEVVRGRA